jgi:hypothetical protein
VCAIGVYLSREQEAYRSANLVRPEAVAALGQGKDSLAAGYAVRSVNGDPHSFHAFLVYLQDQNNRMPLGVPVVVAVAVDVRVGVCVAV